jgi:hypothetical protein
MPLRFKDIQSKIERKIRQAMIRQVNKRLKKITPKIEAKIRPLLFSALISSPEISSLKSGILRAEFGLSEDITDQLVSAIMGSLQVVPVFATLQKPGYVDIRLQPSDYSNLFGESFAFQEIKDGSIPWLEWLLTLGDTIIITDFGVEFGSFKGTRTGMARMSGDFAPYKVDSRFSGTQDDNFITRAISSVTPQLRAIMLGAL